MTAVTAFGSSRSTTTLKVSYRFMLEAGICRGLMLIREDFFD